MTRGALRRQGMRREEKCEEGEDGLAILQADLEKQLGCRVELTGSRDKKRGKMILHFQSMQELEKMAGLLKGKVVQES